MSIFILTGLASMMLGVVAFIIFMERGQRRVPVQYAKRVVGRRVYGGQNTHIPLKINASGVIPPIFASSIIMFPATVANFIKIPWVQSVSQAISPGHWAYVLLYVGFIIFFCFFYTAIVFNPVDVADNMKKYGGFIPGIRPGRPTAEYLDKVLSRITLGGALYVSAVCVLPTLLINKIWCALLLRRDRPADRHRRRNGHPVPDRGSYAVAPLRGFPQERTHEGPSLASEAHWLHRPSGPAGWKGELLLALLAGGKR